MKIVLLLLEYMSDVMYDWLLQSISPKFKDNILNTHMVLKAYFKIQVTPTQNSYYWSMSKYIKDREN